MSYAHFVNHTDKVITAAKFILIYLDGTLDEHEALYSHTTGRIKAGKWTNETWNTELIVSDADHAGGVIVRVTKVLFADGQIWTPPADGANPCDYRKVYRR